MVIGLLLASRISLSAGNLNENLQFLSQRIDTTDIEFQLCLPLFFGFHHPVSAYLSSIVRVEHMSDLPLPLEPLVIWQIL